MPPFVLCQNYIQWAFSWHQRSPRLMPSVSGIRHLSDQLYVIVFTNRSTKPSGRNGMGRFISRYLKSRKLAKNSVDSKGVEILQLSLGNLLRLASNPTLSAIALKASGLITL